MRSSRRGVDWSRRRPRSSSAPRRELCRSPARPASPATAAASSSSPQPRRLPASSWPVRRCCCACMSRLRSDQHAVADVVAHALEGMGGLAEPSQSRVAPCARCRSGNGRRRVRHCSMKSPQELLAKPHARRSSSRIAGRDVGAAVDSSGTRGAVPTPAAISASISSSRHRHGLGQERQAPALASPRAWHRRSRRR